MAFTMVTCPWEYLEKIPQLGQPLTCLKGVGPKRAQLFAKRGLANILSLFYFTPIRYEDRTRFLAIGNTENGDQGWVCGTVVSARENFFPKSRKRLFKVVIEDASGRLNLIWFHYRKAHLADLTGKGTPLLVYGQIQENGPQKQMIHPEIMPHISGHEKDHLGINPVYPTIEGIPRRTLNTLVCLAFRQYGNCITDPLPSPIRRSRALPDLQDALREIHLPPIESPVQRLNAMQTPGHRRLQFDVAFKTMLNLTFRKTARKQRQTPPLTVPPDLEARLEKLLPFSLTPGQYAAVRDILRDFRAGHPMSRLIQGDVGCGKTIVAAIAASVAVHNKKQVAFMAPTQVLAAQHWTFFCDFHPDAGFKPGLLTGALQATEQKKMHREIETGRVNVIIGTQALIQESLTFSNLGLAIIDEQHRFGVRQRALLDRKGHHPHLLVMSATPIPRTLGMTLYGDMDISTIRDLPAGRLPVVTRLVERNRKATVFQFLKRRLQAGQQALVICPLIDAAEDQDMKNARTMAEKLQALLSPVFRVQLIHGRLPGPLKEEIMEDFRKRGIHVLVSTTVIEVGIHVPNATVMIIEQPERFGLAQLHQLRGRIGRGRVQGVCLLMVSQNLTQKARTRLEVLTRSNDGFEIARKDLEMRGQGEPMGMKQAGTGERDLMDAFGDPNLLMAAREEAERIVRDDPHLVKPSNRALRDLLEPEWKTPLEI
ncbi:MAG: ATP-dependent DNA helicase RecG [Deltaproteobacteria bacterium]|nr:ATP-dependent DNA helicase RecG [Deltaproteobacteria bacterium]